MWKRNGTFLRQACLAGLVFFFAGCPHVLADQAPVVARTPDRKIVWRDFLGVNAEPLWFDRKTYVRQFAALEPLGLDQVRIGLHWANMEPQKGHFLYTPLDTLIKTMRHMRIRPEIYMVGAARFDSSAPPDAKNYDQYPPRSDALFAERMAQLVRRYPGVAAWEVWNEPNLPTFWQPQSNARAYGKLLLESVRAIRSVNAHIPIIIGGMAYYSQMPADNNALMLEKLGEGGAFGPHLIAAYHPYTNYPSGDAPYSNTFLQRATLLNRKLRAAGVKQIWANEWGWSSYAGPKEEQPVIRRHGQTEFDLKRLALMSTMDFNKIFLFTLADLDRRASPRDRHYGLLTRNGGPKPVYNALRRFLRTTGPVVYPVQPLALSSPVPHMYEITYKRPDGRTILIYWGSGAGTGQINAATAALMNPATGTQKNLTVKSGRRLRVPVSKDLQILVIPRR